MKILFKYFFYLVLAIPFLSHATTTRTQTITVSATGASEENAIVKALGQAIQQVNGSTINVQSYIHETGQGLIMDWMGNKIVIPSQEINAGFTSSNAGGLIKSYSVSNSQYLKDSKVWKVTISAEVAKYANIGKDRSGLLQIAVFPFHTSHDHYPTVTGDVSASTTAVELNNLMTNDFVQSNKFRMLDRSYWKESNIEEQIITGRSYGNQESIKLGQKLGADYIVTGTIDNFDIIPTAEKMYGSTTDVYQTRFTLQVRVIEVATSDIIWSNTYTPSFDPDALSQKLRDMHKANPKLPDTQLEQDLQQMIYREISNKISQDLIAHITGSPVPSSGTLSAPAKEEHEARPLTPGSSEKPLEWN